MSRRRGTLALFVRALLAGLAGTAAMTLHQELRASTKDESSAGERGNGGNGGDPWDDAPAPAVVGRRALGLVGADVPAERIGLVTNVVHWAYGTAWGTGLALAQRRLPGPTLVLGPAFGATVWALSYAQLVPLGLYEPPWTYPPETLLDDLGYHVTFGTATALAGRVLVGR